MSVDRRPALLMADHDHVAVTRDLAAGVDDRSFLGGIDGSAYVGLEVDAFMDSVAPVAELGSHLDFLQGPGHVDRLHLVGGDPMRHPADLELREPSAARAVSQAVQ